MKITIENQEAFVDEKVRITVSGLTPNSQLRARMKMELPWCSGEEFSSYAVFEVGETGEVDFDQAEPVAGTYKARTSMGLIYSLRLSKSAGKNIAENISIEKPIRINLGLEASSEQKEIQLIRYFAAKNLIIKPVSDGFTGQLFYRENSCDKTILMLGGSDGQMESLALIAGPLASRGFNVLSVPYFGVEGLPEKLEEVPLEYFEKIFHWLETNAITKAEEIYLHGTSKGGELALLLASRYPRIKKVAAVEPHAYCFQALDGLMSGKNVSSWSYQGKSIPFIEVDNNIFFEDQKKAVGAGMPFGFAGTYQKSLERAGNKEEARIKIENSEADILLICGEKDNIWNSYDACSELLQVLKRHNYRHSVQLLSYENMGHPMPVPFVIPLSLTLEMPVNGGLFSSGGTVEGNARGQYESFRKTIEFFN
ncbi:lysophospholipase [Desulfosporosinus orientis DSM 765]|uniref:Lysophospholipase n=1 Tax=Desulfosporosinus orientis (strain ATCC 19365 / DSM 765 / NCIMB 8382 / VKM B-1628 / Singapore I) TaxID=768706 RepID=G7WDG4_DESOD|nr:acyl-CoA thioesterase/bile acid-CoA:amino acid N-acyltransferase family protein [Desulfosporosinus orientis]AET67933.1 lysophospholipase [Desulfosporosinus orientis DSM 765]